MQNLLTELKTLLERDGRLVNADGVLLKNKVIELALSLDHNLIYLLLSHNKLRCHFFTDVDGILVFDKIKFQRFVSNKSFLPDSYTAYKNKIGLTVDDQYLTDSKEVVLAWAYKDCILEGGQTKEDAKRNEVFWNETLAPDQIDRLLAPKVLTNFKKFDKDGERKISDISRNDNLIIKGNNLLALHTLKKRYAGQIKLIYIDPPYNTGNDSFGYNDRFNHSTWLTFMRNRLEIARELLKNDGAILISCDDSEQAYLKILLDEIFTRDNFVATFVWKRRASSALSQNKVSQDHEYVICYQKTASFSFLGQIKDYSGYKNPDNDPNGHWVLGDLTVGMTKDERPNQFYVLVDPKTGNKYEPNPNRVWTYIPETMNKKIEEGRIFFPANLNKRPMLKRYKTDLTEDRNPVSTWIENTSNKTAGLKSGLNSEATREIQSIFGEKIFNYAKPKSLISSFVKHITNNDDLILDFFAGSGTTAQAVLELNKEDGGNRRFILCEQMCYVESVTVPRVHKVIQNNANNSFIYCDLAQANRAFIGKIQEAGVTKELRKIWVEMQEAAFLSYRINLKAIDLNGNDFSTLSLDDQKRFLIEILDKNMLYVPLSEIDDETYAISAEDKKLNHQFHHEE